MKKFVIVLLMLFALGCAQRIILQDENGVTLPKETITAVNPDTGISVEALLIRMVEVSTESYYPTYLSPSKINHISTEQLMFTKEIMLFIRIHNPNHRHYRLTKRVRNGEKPEDYIDKVIFEGTKEMKHFQLLVPREDGKFYQIMAMIDYGGNFPMLRIGYFDILYRDTEE